jgi:hypothetical protein
MGCSNSLKNKNKNVKSFHNYKNIATVERYEPYLKEDYGTICFLELENDQLIVSTQNNKIIIYNIKDFKVIFVIRLTSTVNTIVKIKDEEYIFGDDFGKIHVLGLDYNKNYKIFNSFDCESTVTKIIKQKNELIVSSYKQILFFDLNKKKLEVTKTYNDHLSIVEIFNIYRIDNLLLSFAYDQKNGNVNEIIIYNLLNDEIVYKESAASVIPWNNSVCKLNANLLVIAGNKCEISIFDINTFKIITQIFNLDIFYSVICLKNKIFCGGDSGKIFEFEYNFEKNELKAKDQIKIHKSSIFSINITSSGTIVTTSRDGTIKFFD